MRRAVELGTAFLLAGTVYSDVPYAKVADVRTRNRRLGLGLMGLHEALATAGLHYGDSFDGPLEEYARSGEYARAWARTWNLSEPLKTRAIAPTGTIGIVAETTTGIEPIFCAAYRRRYYDHGTWRAQYVIDPTARRLVEAGIKPEDIEDAYTVEPARRVAFQSYVQRYVDHGISSTINLPAWGGPWNNEDAVKPFGEMLLKYLPELRGITCYPDGARGGQPLSRADFATALASEGEVMTEQADICDIRGGASCGA
jgi:ribonucleoside-diphosphate reductase alpha chain